MWDFNPKKDRSDSEKHSKSKINPRNLAMWNFNLHAFPSGRNQPRSIILKLEQIFRRRCLEKKVHNYNSNPLLISSLFSFSQASKVFKSRQSTDAKFRRKVYIGFSPIFTNQFDFFGIPYLSPNQNFSTIQKAQIFVLPALPKTFPKANWIFAWYPLNKIMTAFTRQSAKKETKT